eukprot:10686883-Lingulodinium_polyedra.AAC.1
MVLPTAALGKCAVCETHSASDPADRCKTMSKQHPVRHVMAVPLSPSEACHGLNHNATHGQASPSNALPLRWRTP